MVNIFRILNPLVRAVMKLAGITSQKVEIEPGTTMNFWAPTKKKIKNSNNLNQIVNRPSVVLLHAFIADGILTWVFQVLALAGEYDVYVPDFLFFGDSITDKPDRSTSFQAECLAKGLRMLGVEKFTVVGFCYGAFVGFKLEKLHPEMVESMIISGAPMEWDDRISRTVNMLLPETIERLKQLITLGSHKKLFTSFPNFVYRDFLEATYFHRKERAELLKALADDELFPAKCSQNLHLLWGENDKIADLDTARFMKRQFGNEVTLQYIPNAGHIAQLERPGLYSLYLKRILASLHT